MPGSLSKGRLVGFSALGALLIVVGVAVYSARVSGPPGMTAQTAQGTAPEATPGGDANKPARSGEVTASITVEPITLTPPARLIAEGLKCVCGCKDFLAECTCDKTPGSHDMKQYLQALVDQGKPPAEVRKAMVEKYGQAVLP